MSQRGRKPKPTKLRVVEGNKGKRKLPEHEPQPTPSYPECPDWFPEDAKREWNRVVPELQRLGLLTVLDEAALEQLCITYARWVEAERWIQEHGTTYVTYDQHGNLKTMNRAPQVIVAENARNDYRRYCHEFGLTPSARTRIKVEDPDGKETNPVDSVIGGV